MPNLVSSTETSVGAMELLSVAWPPKNVKRVFAIAAENPCLGANPMYAPSAITPLIYKRYVSEALTHEPEISRSPDPHLSQSPATWGWHYLRHGLISLVLNVPSRSRGHFGPSPVIIKCMKRRNLMRGALLDSQPPERHLSMALI